MQSASDWQVNWRSWRWRGICRVLNMNEVASWRGETLLHCRDRKSEASRAIAIVRGFAGIVYFQCGKLELAKEPHRAIGAAGGTVSQKAHQGRRRAVHLNP